MAHGLIKSGWQSLDPMFFWKYVMAKKREKPCIVIANDKPKELIKWVVDNPTVNFIIESEEVPGGIDVFLPNVNYRWQSNMTYSEWVERWAWTDYLLCDEEDKDYWMQAKLCGVECVFNKNDLGKMLKNVRVLNSVERITNWEDARSLLT